MKIADALALANHYAGGAPVQTATMFEGLPADLAAELRELLLPVQERGLPCELDPATGMLGVLIDRGIWRIGVVTNKVTGQQTVAILGPDMAPLFKDEWIALVKGVADPLADAAPPPIYVNPVPLPKSLAALQVELLTEIRDLLRDRL